MNASLRSGLYMTDTMCVFELLPVDNDVINTICLKSIQLKRLAEL